MTELDRIRQANADYNAPSLQGPPSRHLCILTCMDTRIDPLSAFGLRLGEAHVIRNAGGRASQDAIRSMVLSAHALGAREFGVVHHTRCGVQTTNEAIQEMLANAGVDARHIDFMAFYDVDQSVRDDVRIIKDSNLLPADSVFWGGVFDVESGALRIVVEP